MSALYLGHGAGMYVKPTVDDFLAALTETGEQLGGDFGHALDTIFSRNAAAGRLKSGATVKMVLNAARDCVDDGANKLLSDLQRFTHATDLDPLELRKVTGEHFELLNNAVLLETQDHIDRLEIGSSAQAMIDEMKQDMVRLLQRKLRQFDIGLWQEGGSGVSITSNTINAGSIRRRHSAGKSRLYVAG